MQKLLLGNEAIGQGLYESGVQVVAAYPGTPSTEITEFAAQFTDLYCEWSTNEKVAAEVAYGASIAGARSFCAQKHVGLNVCADLFFTASYTGINGGMVIAVADDPGIQSSQNEQDSRHYALAAKLPMLEPADSAECLQYTKLAYQLSEQYDTPVFLRTTAPIAHSRSVVEVGDRKQIPLKPYEKNVQKYVMLPAYAQKRHIFVEERLQHLIQYAETAKINEIMWNSKKIGVIAAGASYQYAREALGEKASYLKLGMVYPLPEKLIQEFADSVETLYVLEELDDFIESHCKKIGVNCIGKQVFPRTGAYTAAMIRQVILNEKRTVFTIAKAIPERPPVLCAGCPHRAVFHVLQKMHVTVSGDIGCYSLGAMEPFSAMDINVCMGASISMLHGMEKARGKQFAKNSVAVIGDSTFFHSGMTALLNVVYNKGISTVLILDNHTTAMTGHQDHAATGRTLQGMPVEPVNLKEICKALGVKRVYQLDPVNIAEVETRLKIELDTKEPSVLILKHPCALLQKYEKKKPLKVDAARYHACRKCASLGCPAISFKRGREAIKSSNKKNLLEWVGVLFHQLFGKAEIDAALCAGCGLCKEVCRFHAIDSEDVLV